MYCAFRQLAHLDGCADPPTALKTSYAPVGGVFDATDEDELVAVRERRSAALVTHADGIFGPKQVPAGHFDGCADPLIALHSSYASVGGRIRRTRKRISCGDA